MQKDTSFDSNDSSLMHFHSTLKRADGNLKAPLLRGPNQLESASFSQTLVSEDVEGN